MGVRLIGRGKHPQQRRFRNRAIGHRYYQIRSDKDLENAGVRSDRLGQLHISRSFQRIQDSSKA